MGHGDVAAAPGVLSAPSDHAVPFLVQLGEALTQAGEPEGFVQPRVAQMAAAYRVPAARVVVLPKLTLAAAGPGEPVVLDATPATEPDLRLDQMAVVSGVARLADTASVDPDDGMRALDDAEALPHRFGPVGIVAGHATIALGACLILQPTPMVLLTSTLLGALVGLLKLRAATAPTLRVVLPIVAAVLLSLLVFAVAPGTKTQESLRELIPPLITFLPGGLITSATLDLVVGHLISGATRFVAGSMQLVLLALGIAIGATIAGADLNATTTNTPITPWERGRRGSAPSCSASAATSITRVREAASAGCSSCSSPRGPASRWERRCSHRSWAPSSARSS
jgi:uncharacterized membrane protein YjjP (DUF1212 family)